MLLVWIVGPAKIIVHRDGLDDPHNGLGAKGGDFNTAILNTFQRIVVKGENIQTVLNEQAAIINKVMTDANAKCWGPDGTSSGPCQVK